MIKYNTDSKKSYFDFVVDDRVPNNLYYGLDSSNWYSMGGEILADGDKVPSFLVWAQRDKNGAPLQRVQIIKGSIDQFDSSPTEVIYDVACSNGLQVDPLTNRCPDIGARVDIETC